MTKPTGDRPKLTRKQINTSLQFEIAKQAEIAREELAHGWAGPQCTCHTDSIDGVQYNFINAGCPDHGLESIHIPNPHEGASRGGKRR
jgi:hypothetical protein